MVHRGADMEEEKKPIEEEMKDLLNELEKKEPIDDKGNPFVLLPKKDLIQIKKNIEEISEEFYDHNWKGDPNEKTSN